MVQCCRSLQFLHRLFLFFFFYTQYSYRPTKTKKKRKFKTTREKFAKYIGNYILTTIECWLLTIALYVVVVCRLHIILNIFYCIQINCPNSTMYIWWNGWFLGWFTAVAVVNLVLDHRCSLGGGTRLRLRLRRWRRRLLVTDLGDGVIGMGMAEKKGWNGNCSRHILCFSLQ